MTIRPIKPEEKELYNSVVSHPLQSWEWGEFRESSNIEVVRIGNYKDAKLQSAYQLTFHRLPHIPFTIGYFPKGPPPDEEMINTLQDLGKKHRAIFIQLEPNIIKNDVNPQPTTHLSTVASAKVDNLQLLR
ncbi:MAG: peptidoglycan bridge formation glycyltransferase FemA/FemB family protein, partial [Patescibacteria group bacterium]